MQSSQSTGQPPFPFGVDDLDPRLRWLTHEEKELRCFVRGCRSFVEHGKAACPEHGIRCYKSGTYSYSDPRRNTIIDADLFQTFFVQSAEKVGGDRLGNENSEDTLTWNVFRSLQKAGQLGSIASLLGVPTSKEPTMYLWGKNSSDDSFSTWPLLSAARNKFESGLRPPSVPTEPDVALHVAGEYLLLIEAKFTSPNHVLPYKCRKQQHILRLYSDPQLKIMDQAKATNCEHLHGQLWRNMIFAEWMARQDSEATKAYLVSIVRDGFDLEFASEFGSLVNDGFKDRFRRVTWEQLYEALQIDGEAVARLKTYMRLKTASLRKAFRL